MDYLKRATIKDFTAWDLNCPKCVRSDNKLKRKFVRKARWKLKQRLKERNGELIL